MGKDWLLLCIILLVDVNVIAYPASTMGLIPMSGSVSLGTNTAVKSPSVMVDVTSVVSEFPHLIDILLLLLSILTLLLCGVLEGRMIACAPVSNIAWVSCSSQTSSCSSSP